jgi:hypothetical protein
MCIKCRWRGNCITLRWFYLSAHQSSLGLSRIPASEAHLQHSLCPLLGLTDALSIFANHMSNARETMHVCSCPRSASLHLLLHREKTIRAARGAAWAPRGVREGRMECVKAAWAARKTVASVKKRRREVQSWLCCNEKAKHSQLSI